MAHGGTFMHLSKVEPKVGGRNPSFESSFLDQAERLAGLSSSGFTERVKARLFAAEREYGQDSYLARTMLGLVGEIEQEGEDVTGWSTVAALAAYAKVADEDVRYEAQLRLQRLASYGPLIAEECRQLRELLES